MLELAVLGLLKEAPMSGYELKKQLSLKLGAFWRVSYGSLYPCLKRLAADGALDVEVSPFTSRKNSVISVCSQIGSCAFMVSKMARMRPTVLRISCKS